MWPGANVNGQAGGDGTEDCEPRVGADENGEEAENAEGKGVASTGAAIGPGSNGRVVGGDGGESNANDPAKDASNDASDCRSHDSSASALGAASELAGAADAEGEEACATGGAWLMVDVGGDLYRRSWANNQRCASCQPMSQDARISRGGRAHPAAAAVAAAAVGGGCCVTSHARNTTQQSDSGAAEDQTAGRISPDLTR